ncbi:MAG TPA: type II secretion system protein [Candidatus Saccharimonadia bacterium]|nr:type II secretion system protein [Candidatus Saccharimonadia bacterium]
MLKQLQKRKSEGFTIIEVLIVLAIAGLIMVVVFLAVPALQRSGRNNALNTDANNVLSAVGNYSSNNGGTLPTAITFAAGKATIGAAGTNQETATVGSGTATVKLNGAAITNASVIGTIQVITGTTAVCNSTGTGLAGSASPRSYAILYVAESGSGNILKCVGA